jgi:ribosomal protein L18E
MTDVTEAFGEILMLTWEASILGRNFSVNIARNLVRASKNTQHVSMTKINRLTLFEEIIAVCCENRTKHVNTSYRQSTELLNVKAGGTYDYQCA